MKILITGVGGPAGQALLTQFTQPRHQDHQIIGVDMEPVSHPRLHHFALIPAASDPGMIDQLTDLVRRHRVELVIPTVQDELPQVAEATHQGQFHPARVLIGDPEGVTDSCDKYRTMIRLDEALVPVPRYTCPEYHSVPASLVEAVGECAILKPRISRGSRGVQKIYPAQMAQDDLQVIGSFNIIQEYAPGEEFSPMIYLPSSGRPPVVVIVQKISDASYRSVSVDRVPTGRYLDVARLAVEAARALNLTGPVDMDFRRLSDGQPVVLEINARFGANSAHAPEILDAILRDVAAEGGAIP